MPGRIVDARNARSLGLGFLVLELKARMNPSHGEDADVFAYAVGLLLDQRDNEAAQHLATLSVVDPMPLPPFVSTIDGSSGERKSKESVTTSDRATTFARDGWRCR